MSAEVPIKPFLMPIGDAGKDLSVLAVVLDRFGIIIAVNEQWKRYAEASGLTLPEYGIGENYLRHCAFADPLSPRLIRGLSQLLSGETDRLSVVYSCECEDDERQTWFLLLAFPHPDSSGHIVLMHIDITILVSVFANFRRETAPDDIAGDHLTRLSAPADAAEHALLTLIEEAGRQGHQTHEQKSRKERHAPLSKRQTDVLALMTKGMTNAEIAHELSLSLNTVKVYVSGILARLGLQSRAQVLHWALTRHKDDSED